MFDYAVKNILHRRMRSLMTIGGVMVMMTLVIVVTGIVDYQTRTMNAHAAAGSGKINVQPLLSGGSYPAGGIDLSQETAAAVLQQCSEDIQPDLSAAVLYFALEEPLYPNQPPEVVLTGIEHGREEAFTGTIARDVKPVAGSEFLADGQVPHPAILGQHAAEYYAAIQGSALQPGSTIDILGQSFTVSGILDRSADIVVNNAVIIPLDQAQSLLGKEGFVSALILTAADVTSDAAILQLVEESYPRLQVITDDTVRRNAESGIALFEAMVDTISRVVVLCAALLIMTVMLITVKERTREIGVLRALGASQARIIGSLLLEITLLSLAGSLLGGVASSFILTFALQENLFDLWHILGHLPSAVLLAILAGIVPSLHILRILPVEALRYE